MQCIVTAGPTYEPLDDVRRLINISTGRLGTELADFLVACGHDVTLLRGEHSTHRSPALCQRLVSFGTGADLAQRLESFAGSNVRAVFHAAAVSDFSFGQIFRRSPTGELQPVHARKISTAEGSVLAELTPAPKIIARLRTWFPQALLVGWKYEADGDRSAALARGAQQLADCAVNACVVNGPAYGAGFAIVQSNREALHVAEMPALFEALARLLSEP